MSRDRKIKYWLLSPVLFFIAAFVIAALGNIFFPTVQTPGEMYGSQPAGQTISNLLSFLLGATGLVFIPVGILMAVKIHDRR